MEAHYGAAMDDMHYGVHKSPFAKPQRKSGSTVGIIACFFLPWVIFSSVFLLTSENSMSGISFVVLALVMMFGYAALRVWMRSGELDAPPSTWYWFLFVTSLASWVMGFFLGQENFSSSMEPYIAVKSMNVYNNINPEVATGNQVMDAGQIYFAPGTFVDVNHSLGFRNYETFCVAPIVGSANHKGPYDFWAVGTNCCSGHLPDFACGDYNNPSAYAGLRLMKDDQRGFYRLAVQQTQAHYGITSVNPIFLTWVADPQGMIDSYQQDAQKGLVMGIFGDLVLQLFLTILAFVTFAKLGW